MPGHPLIPRRGRPWAVTAVALAVLVVAVLALLTHDRQGSAPDHSVTMFVFYHSRAHWLARALLELSDPAFDVGVLATIAIGAGWRRAWRISVFAVVGPLAALLISEKILKPLVHRTIGHGLAFPSGHETGIASVAIVVAVLLLRTAAHLATKVVVLVGLLAWCVLAAAGLVRAFVHYPTDTVGGVCVALAAVLVTAMVVDAIADRHDRSSEAIPREPFDARVSEPVAPDRPRTARAT